VGIPVLALAAVDTATASLAQMSNSIEADGIIGAEANSW
jgi:hypothetical protein